MVTWFDESRLDDETALERADGRLRQLAEAGARVRREVANAAEATDEAVARMLEQQARPRAVIAAGPDSRLLRAVLEPWCPVPFVAWPGAGLPGWAGSLDLVVVLAPDGVRHRHRRRGRGGGTPRLPGRGRLPAELDRRRARRRAGGATSCPTSSRDQLATAVVMLEFLERVTLGPHVDAERVATALDEVAIACSPHRDLAVNPAKMLAIALADTNPVVWGGSVLAARAARRIAESIRRASGRTALAGDAEHLLPGASRRPARATCSTTRSPTTAGELRPMLLVLDDGSEDALVRENRGRLQAAADARGVRVETADHRRPHRGRPLRLALPQRLLRRGVPPTRPRRGLDQPRSWVGIVSCPRRHRETRPAHRQGARPLARQRQDGAGHTRRARPRLDAAARRPRCTDILYDFLYAWHVPAFVFVTGYLSRALPRGSKVRMWRLVRTVVGALPRLRVAARGVPDLRRWRAPRGPLPRSALADVVPLGPVLLAPADPVVPPDVGRRRRRGGDQPGRRPLRRGHPRHGPGPRPAARSS